MDNRETKFSEAAPIIEFEDGFRAIHKDYVLNSDNNKRGRVIINEALDNADDFISFVSEFKTPSTKVFYNDKTVRAIFNYSQHNKPDFHDSRVDLNMSASSAFSTLKQFMDKPLPQADLIVFLKQCEPYFSVGIDSIGIIEIVQNLIVTTKVNSINANTKRTAIVNIEMKSGALGHVDLPTKLCVTLPLFRQMSETLTDFPIELFYDIKDDMILTTLKCWTFDETVEIATRDIVTEIVRKLNLQAYRV